MRKPKKLAATTEFPLIAEAVKRVKRDNEEEAAALRMEGRALPNYGEGTPSISAVGASPTAARARLNIPWKSVWYAALFISALPLLFALVIALGLTLGALSILPFAWPGSGL